MHNNILGWFSVGKKKKSYLVWAETVFPAVERRPREGERSWGPFYPSEIKLTVQ